MKTKTLVAAAVLLVFGGALGWTLAPSPENDSEKKVSPDRAIARSMRVRESSPSLGARGPGEDLMQEITESSSEAERMRAAISLANSLPLDQAGQWLDQGLFSQRNGFALTLFTKILRERWEAGDPEGFLVWQLGNGEPVPDEKMTRLAENSPELLLVNIRLIDDLGAKTQALAALAKVRPGLALAELAKMDQEELRYTEGYGQIFREVAKKDPGSLRAVMDELPYSLQMQAKRVIFEVGLSEDFSGTLAELLKEPNGLQILSSSHQAIADNRESFLSAFSTLPKSWKNRMEGHTFMFTNGMNFSDILSTDWAKYGVSTKAIGEIQGGALFSEIRGKPDAVERFRNSDLSEGGRRYLLDMLRWNGGQETIAELLPHLDQGDRDYISKRLASERPPDTQASVAKVDTAAALSEVLESVDKASIAKYSSVMRNLSAEQKARFREDYAAMQGNDRHRVTAVLVGSDDLDLKAAALSELLGNPEAQEVVGWNEAAGIEAASQVTIKLLQQDVERAVTWVGGLPEGDSRTWAMKNLAANWKNYDPEGSESWVNSLPEAEQKEVRAFIKKPE